MPDRPWGPDEGVPEVPAEEREIDITDAALADRATPATTDALGTPPAPDTWDTGGDDANAGLAGLAGLARLGGPDLADADLADPVADPGTDPGADPDGAEPGVADLSDPVADDTADAPTPPLRKILESILLVVDQPVPEVELAQVLEAPRATVLAELEDLSAEYLRDGRGFELRQIAGGWRLYTAPDCAPYVERFVLDGQQARLTQAALETLAVVAYRQPVSRQSIAAIRGVNVDGVIRTLLTRGLIAEAGEEGPSGAHLYVTTPYFLERLGLRSLDELPNLAPLLPANVDDLVDGV